MNKIFLSIIAAFICPSLYAESRIIHNGNRETEPSDKIVILNTTYEDFVSELWLPIENIMAVQLTQDKSETKTTYIVEITTKALVAVNGGSQSMVHKLYYPAADKVDAEEDVIRIMSRYLSLKASETDKK